MVEKIGRDNHVEELHLQTASAIGKCKSLFKFFGGIMKKCVDPSLPDSLAIANNVQSGLAHLQSEDSLRNVESEASPRNAEVRKRRMHDQSLG